VALVVTRDTVHQELTMLHRFEAAIAELAELLRARGQCMATAESCTGGLIAAACTQLPGSSDWFDCGFVTYSNGAKRESIGVPPALLEEHGAVSEAVVMAMAEGALAHSGADWTVAVTGIAGPGGAVPGKPVGTVWLAVARRGGTCVPRLLQLAGDRSEIRAATVDAALSMLCHQIGADAQAGVASQ
jgi:nicotinamide-nucleotide amidase